MNLRMDRIAYPVTSLGPGRRVALWVAGCSRRCSGCITPHLLPWRSGQDVDVSDLAARLEAMPMPLDGLTLTGGDPADQPAAVEALLRQVRARLPRWDVLMYTGDVLERMRTDPLRAPLLEWLDVLIDGPYQREIPPTHPLAGSGNQRVLALSGRGRAMLREMNAHAPAFNLGLGEEDFLIGVSDAATRARMHALLAGADLPL